MRRMPHDLDLDEGGAEDGAEESHLGSIRPTSTRRRAALPQSSEGRRGRAVFFECICGDLTRLAHPDRGGGLGRGDVLHSGTPTPPHSSFGWFALCPAITCLICLVKLRCRCVPPMACSAARGLRIKVCINILLISQQFGSNIFSVILVCYWKLIFSRFSIHSLHVGWELDDNFNGIT